VKQVCGYGESRAQVFGNTTEQPVLYRGRYMAIRTPVFHTANSLLGPDGIMDSPGSESPIRAKLFLNPLSTGLRITETTEP